MPNFTIYIRKEDVERWQSINNKPEFIHNALMSSNIYPKGETIVPGGKVVVGESRIKEEDCPRHHVPLSLCENQH